MLTETRKKNWAGQHLELLYWTPKEQFKSKMNLPLEKVSKIPLGALTNLTRSIFSCFADNRLDRLDFSYHNLQIIPPYS